MTRTQRPLLSFTESSNGTLLKAPDFPARNRTWPGLSNPFSVPNFNPSEYFDTLTIRIRPAGNPVRSSRSTMPLQPSVHFPLAGSRHKIANPAAMLGNLILCQGFGSSPPAPTACNGWVPELTDITLEI